MSRKGIAMVAGGGLVAIAIVGGGIWALARYAHQAPSTAVTFPSHSPSPSGSVGPTATPASETPSISPSPLTSPSVAPSLSSAPTPLPSRSQSPAPPLVSRLVPAPAPRSNAAMVYDATRKNVVLFGGCSAGCTGADYLSDTWTWDGAHWTKHSPATNPQGRYSPAIAYDAGRSVVVMSGGANGDFSDTWIWDGTNWTEMHPSTSPLPLHNGTTAMDYDPVINRVVLFSVGQTPDQYSLISETWTWNGTDWTQVTPSRSPLFPSGFAFTMTYDPPSKTVLLLSRTSGAWGFDGVTWTALSTPAVVPAGQLVAYDAANSTIVLVGRSNDLWTWNGTAWTQLSPPNFPDWQNFGPTVTYDGAHGVVVLFGGQSNIIWTWDGSTWTRVG